MIELNDKNFNEELNNRKLVLVDFYATWCGPCSMQSDVLKNINNSRNIAFDILKVNVDEAPNLATQYGIESIPTLLIFKEGKLLKRTVGLTNEEEIMAIMEEFED